MSKDSGGKIRGFFFEIDGDNETLQEGLRNFGAALGRALSGPARPAPRAALGVTPKRNTPALADEIEEMEEAEEVEPDLFNVEPPKPKKATVRKAAPLPKIIALDLEGKSATPFNEFATAKKPKTNTDRYLVIAAWLNDNGVPEVTADHMFSCFKIMEWTPHPSSYSTALNDLKNKQKMVDSGSAPGAYKINMHGLNLVSKMGTEE